MSTKLVCPDCGGIIGHTEPGETPCSCFDSEMNLSKSDTAAIESPSRHEKGGAKVCMVCGKDLHGHRRVKDSRGYMCYACAKSERAAEKEGKLACKECRRLVKPAGLVAYQGKMICRKCYGDHQETARFKKKVSTKHFDEHERRTLIVLSCIFAVLALLVAYSYFFKMR